MTFELSTPPYLQRLGYGQFEILHKLGRKMISILPDRIVSHAKWQTWRNILEYLACVEHARSELHGLPKGLALGGATAIPAKYHSASMVFFAQAALDNSAEWLRMRANFEIPHSQCVFHKKKFVIALAALDGNFEKIINLHLPYINLLKRYRHTWIHRLNGGAEMFCDRNPGEPGAIQKIMVPIDPTLFIDFSEDATWFARVESVKLENNGEWLYSIDNFANLIADNCRDFLLDIIKQGLETFANE